MIKCIRISPDNKWITTAIIYDKNDGLLTSYKIPLNKDSREIIPYVIVGKLRTEYPYETSFSELVSYSEKLNQPVILPDSIDLKTSFVIHATDTKLITSIIRKYSTKDVYFKKVGEIRNWKELTNKINIILNETELKKLEKGKPNK